MKVFISWSGARSKIVALALRQWLPDVIQSVEPWMSAEDIEAGARWGKNISDELEKTQFGIICVTPENQHAPWILFEAGALAKTLENTFVCPYLIDLVPSQLQGGPLTQFQSKIANETQTWEIIRTINRSLVDGALPEDRLRKTFERWWPDLEKVVNNIPKPEETQEAKRSLEDMTEEILELIRQIVRTPQYARMDIIKESIDLQWETLKNYTAKRRPSVAAFLERGRPVVITQDLMVIDFAKEDSFCARGLLESENLSSVEEAAEQVYGRALQVKIEIKK